jgi:salicylate hydroxylase
MMRQVCLRIRLQAATVLPACEEDVVLNFADGSTAQHTAVFGCDGIKSRLRPIVLARSDPAPAVFSGKYVYRGLLPMDKAIEIMGGDEHRTPQLHMGYHGHLITFPIAGGKIMNGKSTGTFASTVR